MQVTMNGQEYTLPPMTISTFKQIKKVTGKSAMQLIDAEQQTFLVTALVAIGGNMPLVDAMGIIREYLEAGGDFGEIIDAVHEDIEARKVWLRRANPKIQKAFSRAIAEGR